MERKVAASLNWNLSCVTPFALLDEVFHSIKYPESRLVGKDSNFRSNRTNMDRLIFPLFSSIMNDSSLCSLRPSIILRACLDELSLIHDLNQLLDFENFTAILHQLLPCDQVIITCFSNLPL